MSKIRDSHTGRIVFVNSKDFLSYLLAFGVLVRPSEMERKLALVQFCRNTTAKPSPSVQVKSQVD